jgi:hypothetical protein
MTRKNHAAIESPIELPTTRKNKSESGKLEWMWFQQALNWRRWVRINFVTTQWYNCLVQT